MKSINLIVLLNDSPMGRAYLAILYSLGLRPKKIIQLIHSNNPIDNKRFLKYLPSSSFRLNILEKIHHNLNFYWPKQLLKKEEKFVNGILGSLADITRIDYETMLEVIGRSDLKKFCDEILKLEIDNYNDERLVSFFSKNIKIPFLYTGGGILPSSIFEIKSLKIIHIHPGLLPYVRGADGFFWSILTRKKIGLSCFYMNEGLDTGDLIKTIELPVPKFLCKKVNYLDEKTLYRTIYSFCDPILRAYFLKIILESNVNIDSWKGKKQDIKKGLTFHFMSKNLQKKVYEKIFSN